MSSLTWLHLSDWHQKDNDFDRRVVRDALLKDIENRKKINHKLGEIDFIVFSGDLANTGAAAEYKHVVKQFFSPLMRATQMGENFWNRLFIVPGNHDLDRRTFAGLPAKIHEALKTHRGVNHCLSDKGMRGWLLSPFSEYSQFIQNTIKALPFELEEPAYFHSRSITKGGKTIGIAGLNSSWLCGQRKDALGKTNDYGHLLLGEPPLDAAMKRIKDCDIRIAVMHHPITWLTDRDRDLVEERLYRECHFVLHGHQHLPRVHVIKSTIGDTINIPAGTIYNDRLANNPRYDNSYNFVHLDFETSRGTVYLRRWSDPEGKWIRDQAYGGEGSFHFVLPKLVETDKEEVYSTQMSEIARQVNQRFCDEHVVLLKHSVENHNGICLVRQDVRQELIIARGIQQTFKLDITLSPNDRMAKLVSRIDKPIPPFAATYFMVNNKSVSPLVVDNKISYIFELDENRTKIKCEYTIYICMDDFFMLTLKRFTKKFQMSVEKAPELDYEFNKLSKIPTTHWRFHAHIEEIKSNEEALCRPGQGYVIQWYPKSSDY